jgi:hypothetical protein
MNLLSRNLGQQSSLFVKRTFAKEAKKASSQFRLRPLTRDDRPIIQKHRKINEEHEQLAEAMGLPFRVLGATYVIVTLEYIYIQTRQVYPPHISFLHTPFMKSHSFYIICLSRYYLWCVILCRYLCVYLYIYMYVCVYDCAGFCTGTPLFLPTPLSGRWTTRR